MWGMDSIAMEKHTQDLFWSYVDKNGPVPAARPDLGPCWIWLKEKTEAGYGRFSIPARSALSVRGKRTKVMAYRFSYELANGPIPSGYEPDHLCKNRACVNHSHLRVLTHKENTLAGDSFSAVNAMKTHCHKVHEFTKENTAINKFGNYIDESLG